MERKKFIILLQGEGNMLDNMAIGLVVKSFDKGGLEQVVYNLYYEYRKRGIPAYVLIENSNGAGYFTSRLLSMRDFCIFDSFETFIAFCYRNKITHLHYHYSTAYIEQARKCGIKTLYTIHNVYTWFDDETIENYAWTLNRCDKIVAVSSLVKEYFSRRSGMRNDRISVISNGTDIGEVLFAPKLPENLTRCALGIRKNDIVFAQIASFTPVKHQIGLIGVMEQVKKKYRNAKLLLVGNVIDPQYYEDFSKELKNSTAKDCIIEVPFFDHKFMGQFLRETVDVSVLTTIQEGCSNSVIEAQICGKPQIITEVGNAKDIHTGGVIIVPPAFKDLIDLKVQETTKISREKNAKNRDSIVSAFEKMILHLDEYKKMAKSNSDISHSLSTQRMADEYIKIMDAMK